MRLIYFILACCCLHIATEHSLAQSPFRHLNSVPTAPDQLAVDDCGNAYALVDSYLWRFDLSTQHWDQLLALPRAIRPQDFLRYHEGEVTLSRRESYTGTIYDYRIKCDGTVVDHTMRLSVPTGLCEQQQTELHTQGAQRLFMFRRVEAQGVVSEYPLAVQTSPSSPLVEVANARLDSAFSYRITTSLRTGELFVAPFPNRIENPVSMLPALLPLPANYAAYRLFHSEQADNLDRLTALIGRPDPADPQRWLDLAFATYDFTDERWVIQDLDITGFAKADYQEALGFVLLYEDRVERYDPAMPTSPVATRNLARPLTEIAVNVDLGVGVALTAAGTVAYLPDQGSEFTIPLPPGAIDYFEPTLRGTVLAVHNGSWLELDSTNTASLIDFATEARIVGADSLGVDVYYTYRTGNGLRLVQRLSNGDTVGVRDVSQGFDLHMGAPGMHLLRSDGQNFRLTGNQLSPLRGSLTNAQLTIRGPDTLYLQNRAVMLKRGGRTQVLAPTNPSGNSSYLQPVVVGDWYVLTQRFSGAQPISESLRSSYYTIDDLEFGWEESVPGDFRKIGNQLFNTRRSPITGPERLRLYSVNEGADTVTYTSITIPTRTTTYTERVCENGRSFERLPNVNTIGFRHIASLGGRTYLSGSNGLYVTDTCLSTQRTEEQACLEGGAPVLWRGQTVTSPGLYVDDSPLGNCPSTAYLRVGRSSDFRFVSCLRSDSSYAGIDSLIGVPGSYQHVTIGAAGCVTRINLDINAPDTLRFDTILPLGATLFGTTIREQGQTVRIESSEGDCKQILAYTVRLTSSTHEPVSLQNVRVQPTLVQSHGQFRLVGLPQEEVNVSAFTLSGKPVSTFRLQTGTYQLSPAPRGQYLIQVETAAGRIVRRIILSD